MEELLATAAVFLGAAGWGIGAFWQGTVLVRYLHSLVMTPVGAWVRFFGWGECVV